MPIVPRANPNDISRIDALPGVRNRAEVPDASGMFRAVGQVTGQVVDAVQQYQDRTDVAAVMDAQRELSGWRNEWDDPNNPNGVHSYKGENALKLPDAMFPDFDKRVGEIAQRLPSQRARQKFMEAAQGEREQVRSQVYRYASSENEQALAQKHKAYVATSVNDLARLDDPAAFEAKRAQIRDTIFAKAGADGTPAEAAAFEVASIVSAAHVTRASALADADPLAAQDYLDKYGEEIEPDQLVRIEGALRPVLEADTALSTVRALLDGQAPPTAEGLRENPRVKPRGEPSTQVKDAIEAASVRHGVPAYLLYALAEQESGFNPKAYNGEYGAAGILQFIPGTAAKHGIDPYNVEQAIDAAAKDAAERIKAGGIDEAIASHFAGPGGGNRGPKTRQYVQEVKARAARWAKASGADVRAAVGSVRPQTLNDALAVVRALPEARNPIRRAQLERQMEGEFRLRKNQEEEAERLTLESIYTKVEDGDPRTPVHKLVTAPELAYLKRTGRLDTIENRLRQRREGSVVAQDNAAVVGPYLQMHRDQPGAFAKMDVHRNAEHMTRETYKQLLQMQQDVRDGKHKPQDYATENEQLAQFVYRPLKLEGKGAEAKRAEFESAWFNAKREHVARTGKQPDAVEREAMLKRLVTSYALHNAPTGGKFTPDYEAAGLPTRVPDADRVQILDAFKARGLPPPDEKTIRTLYLRNQG